MKAIKLTSVLAAVLALTFISTGCQKRPKGITPINSKTTQIRPGEMGEVPPINLGNNNGTGADNLGTPLNPPDWMRDPNAHTEDAAALAAHVVHFDYDSSVIKSGEKANVSAVASYMKSNGDVGLRVDGHCDERGTEGYNDALGERRASALREALIAEGVNADHVITQSWGERKPVAHGHDESSYAQNRRGEFIVLRRK